MPRAVRPFWRSGCACRGRTASCSPGLIHVIAGQTAALLNGPDWQQAAYVMVRGQLPPAALLVVVAARCLHSGIGEGHLAMMASWVPPVFPLTGAAICCRTALTRVRAVGEMLRKAEQIWVSGFCTTKAN